MTLDARFNDFVVLPYEDSIVGLRKTSDGEWEVWILKLSTHPELETSKVTLKDSERVSSSFNISVNPSTKTPRLLSLLNDETTRQKAQQNNSDAILPATRVSDMKFTSNKTITIAFSNAIINLRFDYKIIKTKIDEKNK